MRQLKISRKDLVHQSGFVPPVSAVTLLVAMFFLVSTVRAADQIDIPGPTGSGLFGADVITLSNGNFVVTDPGYDITNPALISNVGAVYLYNGQTLALISRLTGSTANDQTGLNNVFEPGVTALPNGNFVVKTFNWDNAGVQNVGALTFCDGTVGCNGEVSAANSLIGSQTNDFVSAAGVRVLANGHYIVFNLSWDNGAAVDAGALAWCSATSGCTGVLSSSNSLVGSTTNDRVGSTEAARLADGDYVVFSPNWDGAAVDTGAATWCSGTAGCTGVVSAANSLVGSRAGDRIATRGITELSNGNYVLQSPEWNTDTLSDAGAATWCPGSGGCTGPLSAANSVVGSTAGEQAGNAVTALTNGKYVVASPLWDNVQTNIGAVRLCSDGGGCVGAFTTMNSLVGSQSQDMVGVVTALTNGNYVVNSSGWNSPTQTDVGASTFCNGTSGCTGAVSAANSLVGPNGNSRVGSEGTVPLTNGNYVVRSANWNGGAGAATFCSGTTGCTGTVNDTNSLAGGFGHQIGSLGIFGLPNGNYFVVSPRWDNGATLDVGAVTWCSGAAGCTGAVTAANSLIGTQTTDLVGGNQSNLNFVLSNGDYIIHSPFWNNGGISDAGAVTRCSGTGGCVGAVSSGNSAVGATVNERMQSAIGLAGGNYVVASPFWDGDTATDVGAVRWCNGSAGGCTGVLTAANSLVGTTASDNIGNLTALANGDYVVGSQTWDNGPIINAGAVTYGVGNGSTVGPITAANSVRGMVSSPALPFTHRFTFDSVNQQLVVGRPSENTVTVFRLNANPPVGSISGVVSYGTTPIGQSAKFVTGVLLAAAGSVPINASTDAANATTVAGTVLTIPISLGDTIQKGVVAYEFTLEFDPTVLGPPLDAAMAGTLSEGWSVTVNSGIPGRVTVTAYSTQELTGTGTLLNLNFAVIGESRVTTTPLKWARFELNEGEVPLGLLKRGRDHHDAPRYGHGTARHSLISSIKTKRQMSGSSLPTAAPRIK